MIMASLSGSAVADTTAVAARLVPMMRSANYPVNRAAGLVAYLVAMSHRANYAPSIPFIIFGVSSGLSISKLFMAGIAPGMMMGATLNAYILVWQASCLNLPRQQKQRYRNAGTVCLRYLGLFLPVIIIGGFRSGLFTPTRRPGAVAAFYALFRRHSYLP